MEDIKKLIEECINKKQEMHTHVMNVVYIPFNDQYFRQESLNKKISEVTRYDLLYNHKHIIKESALVIAYKGRQNIILKSRY